MRRATSLPCGRRRYHLIRNREPLHKRRLSHVPSAQTDTSTRAADTTTASATPAAKTAKASVAPDQPKDERPWLQRHWKSIAFTSFVGAWAYSLWVQNRSRKNLDAARDEMRDRLPVNFDEILELRALNDLSAAELATYTSVLELRAISAAPPSKLLAVLSEALRRPLREANALERVLSGLAEDAASARVDDAPVETSTATIAIAFLPNGSVRDRLVALFDSLRGTAPALAVDRLVDAVRLLVAAGQVPVDRAVHSEHLGKGAIGIERSWYTIEPARQLSARELVDAAIDECEPACKEGEAEPALPHNDTLRADGARLDAEAFVALLVSSSICLWGECHNIAERKRRQRQREEEEEYARNPPWWQFWKRSSGLTNDNEAGEPGGMTHSR